MLQRLARATRLTSGARALPRTGTCLARWLSTSSSPSASKAISSSRLADYSKYTKRHGEPEQALAEFRSKKGYLIDMDGVVYHGGHLLDGAREFVQWLQDEDKEYLFLTNSSERSRKELAAKLARMGISVGPAHFYTSALATAAFLSSQVPGGSAYVIGEPGLIAALYDVGFSMNDTSPDFVIVGETRNYTYERIERAVHLVRDGARLIGTNIDVTDKMHSSYVPATGALIAPIELASGCKPYYVGKPNPMMMRTALEELNVAPEEAGIIGDRMDTDILGGLQSGIQSALVLSGVTTLDEILTYAYRPDCVIDGVGCLPS